MEVCLKISLVSCKYRRLRYTQCVSVFLGCPCACTCKDLGKIYLTKFDKDPAFFA
uniref:Uncharacterized protein n=1 Tax=Picea sitchensis TaxID=3332 RepID=A9NLU5_PICSI|nr:unknown [Picea sitchensis]